MKQMSYVHVRVDSEVKNQAAELFSHLGLSMTGAITLFLKTAVERGALPFRPSFKHPKRKPRPVDQESRIIDSIPIRKEKSGPFRDGFEF